MGIKHKRRRLRRRPPGATAPGDLVFDTHFDEICLFFDTFSPKFDCFGLKIDRVLINFLIVFPDTHVILCLIV